MQLDGPRASLPSTAAGAAQALAACADPAWLIDPAKGHVLAANPAGAARLGLHPDAASGTLDAAMPGLVRLRAMMREPLGDGRREPLVFWTAYGAENLVCDVANLPDEANTPDLVLVSLASGARRRLLPAPAGGSAPALPPPVTPTPGDAVTMTKIAAAIRNGFSAGRSAEETPDTTDDTALPNPRTAQVSKLAHELRTPLSAIAAAAEIMKDQRFGPIENERYLTYTSDIHDNARHALALIERLLGDKSADDAAPSGDASELDLNALAEASVSALKPLADEAGLNLICEFHRELPKVKADATTIKQILFNLISNAIKFTPRGGDVRIVTGLGFDRSIFIAVQDTGVGMTNDAIVTALNAEVPAHPQRSRAGGHGIGLPLARDLAKSNGARLEIDSQVGEGTAVALVFPRDRIAAHTPVSN